MLGAKVSCRTGTSPNWMVTDLPRNSLFLTNFASTYYNSIKNITIQKLKRQYIKYFSKSQTMNLCQICNFYKHFALNISEEESYVRNRRYFSIVSVLDIVEGFEG